MARREEQSLLGRSKSNGTSIISRNESTEPVRLTPAWEARNLPDDELNFKSMTMDRAKMETSPPRDRFMIIFFILILHGIGTLTPWNMFITAQDYFEKYKLSPEYTGSNNTLWYVANFTPYIGFASQIPNVLFNWLNIFVNLGGNLTTRVVWSLIIEIILFLVTVVLAMVDSSAWPETFFWTTMVTVVILNMAGGIFQNTVYGMAAKLPPKYTGAVVLGSNISGTFATIMSILSTSIWSSVRKAAIYYFITAMFVILLCFDTYFAMPLNRFYRYHEMISEKEQEKARRSGINVNARPPYFKIFKESFLQLFNIFCIFFVTLSIFPAVHSKIEQKGEGEFLGFVPRHLFTSITCFLTFNVFAMFGSLATSFVKIPGPKYLIYPVLLRFLLIPFFLFCNYHPVGVTRVLPVYFDSDIAYWSAAIIMSFSSGYLSTLGMMYCPQSQTNSQYQIKAGMMAAAMLITGIVSGIFFSSVLPMAVTIDISSLYKV